MPLERPYCSLLDVQQETKNSGSELDEVYATAINLASRWVDGHCQRDFWFHDHASSALAVPRSRVLEDMALLPFPILTLTEVACFTDITAGPTAADVLAAEDYFFEVGSPVLTQEAGVFGQYPFKGFLRLKGTFGYPLSATDPTITPPPTIPPDVRRAATLIAAAFSDENHKEQTGLDGQRIALLDTQIPIEARTLLKPWREVSNYAL